MKKIYVYPNYISGSTTFKVDKTKKIETSVTLKKETQTCVITKKEVIGNEFDEIFKSKFK